MTDQKFINELNRIRDEFGWMELDPSNKDGKKIVKAMMKFIDVLIKNEFVNGV